MNQTPTGKNNSAGMETVPVSLEGNVGAGKTAHYAGSNRSIIQLLRKK